jgi:hypothetical protein
MEPLAICLSFLGLAAWLTYAAWLVFDSIKRRPNAPASSLLVEMVLCGILAAASLASWISGSSFPWLHWEQITVPAAVGLGLVLRTGVFKRFTAQLDRLQWRVPAMAHLLLLVAAGWQFHLSTCSEGSVMEEPYAQKGITVDNAVLVTDQGRVFPMFHYDLQGKTYEDAPPFTYVTAVAIQQPAAAARRPVRIAPADPRSNCHGWVFTGGDYGISEIVVDALLQDNGYQRVDSPQAGDVVVYRDAAGVVLHTGRVYRVHNNGEVWIESKWGAGGRYLHLPEDQSYSANGEYYRSIRPGHPAQIISIPHKSGNGTKDSTIASVLRRPRRRARA